MSDGGRSMTPTDDRSRRSVAPLSAPGVADDRIRADRLEAVPTRAWHRLPFRSAPPGPEWRGRCGGRDGTGRIRQVHVHGRTGRRGSPTGRVGLTEPFG